MKRPATPVAPKMRTLAIANRRDMRPWKWEQSEW
jgi:hypothetical protein